MGCSQFTLCINMLFVWTNIMKVFKYVIYYKSVFKTGHLTAVWTENVSKSMIELKSMYLTW